MALMWILAQYRLTTDSTTISGTKLKSVLTVSIHADIVTDTRTNMPVLTLLLILGSGTDTSTGIDATLHTGTNTNTDIGTNPSTGTNPSWY